jgi:FixJ family two-component response regulator
VIAIVDDNAGVRTALERLIRAHGYGTEAFASGNEFLSAAPTSKAACFVVDIGLGNASGLEMVRQLFLAGPRFPVVFMTGIEDASIKKRAMTLGCVAYLRKPFSPVQLIEAIEKSGTCTRSYEPQDETTVHRQQAVIAGQIVP